jgi:hypothetical protein
MASGVPLTPSPYPHHRLFVLPANAGAGDCDWNGIATIGCEQTSCSAWVRGYSGDLIGHELGHNVGLNHAATDVNNDGRQDVEYGDISCTMGSEAVRSYKRFHVTHRLEAGWLNPASIREFFDTDVVSGVEVVSASLSDARSPDVVLLKVRRGAATFWISYRTLAAPDSLSYDKSLPVGWRYHVYIHRFTAGRNTILQGRLEPGEGYLNAPFNFYAKFDSADPLTEVATVSVLRCLPAAPTLQAPALLEFSGACKDGPVTGSLELTFGNPAVDCGPIEYTLTVSGMMPEWTANGRGVCQSLNITVVPDNFPEETSWFVQSRSGSIDNIFSSDINGLAGVYVPSFCPPVGSSSVTFTVLDQFLDGMCCQNGQGSFSVALGGTQVAAGGEFARLDSRVIPLVPTFAFSVPSGGSHRMVLNLTAPQGSVPYRSVVTVQATSVLGTVTRDVAVSLGCDNEFSTMTASATPSPSPTTTPSPSRSCRPEVASPPSLQLSPSRNVQFLDVDCGVALRSQMTLVVSNPGSNCPAQVVTVARGLPHGWTLGPRAACQNVSVVVVADGRPQQVAWTLSAVGPGGAGLLLSSGAVGTLNATLPNYCGVPGETLQFNITDSGGDGLCCAFGAGSYSVVLGGTVVASGGSFGASQSRTFLNLPTWSSFVTNGLLALLETTVGVPAGLASTGTTLVNFTSSLPTGAATVVANVTIRCRSSATPSVSQSPAASPSLSLSPSVSRSASAPPSLSRSPSASRTRTQSPSGSRTPSPSRLGSPSVTGSASRSPSRTASRASRSRSQSASLSRSRWGLVGRKRRRGGGGRGIRGYPVLPLCRGVGGGGAG